MTPLNSYPPNSQRLTVTIHPAFPVRHATIINNTNSINTNVNNKNNSNKKCKNALKQSHSQYYPWHCYNYGFCVEVDYNLVQSQHQQSQTTTSIQKNPMHSIGKQLLIIRAPFSSSSTPSKKIKFSNSSAVNSNSNISSWKLHPELQEGDIIHSINGEIHPPFILLYSQFCKGKDLVLKVIRIMDDGDSVSRGTISDRVTNVKDFFKNNYGAIKYYSHDSKTRSTERTGIPPRRIHQNRPPPRDHDDFWRFLPRQRSTQRRSLEQLHHQDAPTNNNNATLTQHADPIIVNIQSQPRRIYQPQSLLQLTIRTIATNIEKYTPHAMAMLSECHWECIVDERIAMRAGNTILPLHVPLIPVKHVEAIEYHPHNPHLLHSKAMDVILWKDLVKKRRHVPGVWSVQ